MDEKAQHLRGGFEMSDLLKLVLSIVGIVLVTIIFTKIIERKKKKK